MSPLVRDPRHIEAVLFDFSDVVGVIRMALSGERAVGPYVISLYEDVSARISQLRDTGMKTALITNHDREPFLRLAPDIRLSDLFDLDVFSSDVGVAKPDPRIFKHVLSKLGVEADRSLFLDDVPRNVGAAAQLGIQGIVIDKPATAAAVIDEILETRKTT